MNDRPDLAVLAGADFVHVGQDDIPVEAARSFGAPGRALHPRARGDRRGRRRLHRRRARPCDPDEGGPAGGRPRARPLRGGERDAALVRDRRNRRVERRGRRRRGRDEDRGRAGDRRGARPRARRARASRGAFRLAEEEDLRGRERLGWGLLLRPRGREGNRGHPRALADLGRGDVGRAVSARALALDFASLPGR